MSATLYFITMVSLTILLNLALSGYNAVILRRIIDGIRPFRSDEAPHAPPAASPAGKATDTPADTPAPAATPDGTPASPAAPVPGTKMTLRGYQRLALAFGVSLAAFLRIGLTLILSDLLIFPYTKIAAGLLLLWTSWSLFRSLTSPPPEERDTLSVGLSEAILKIIIADLALGLDNILAVACVSIHHHAILISGLVISILAVTVSVMLAPGLMMRLRWLGWGGLAIMLCLSLHLLVHGFQNAHLPFVFH